MTKSMKDRFKAGVSSTDKFEAAEAAMAVGALAAPAPTALAVQAQPPAKVAGSVKALNADFVPGARVTKKTPKGDSVIIRETFSLPPGESMDIDAARRRCAVAGVMLNRSEVIRAGIAALAKLDDATFLAVTSSVPKLKTGRPSSN